MDWLLSPTNYMIELVAAKQHTTNGQTLEVLIYLVLIQMNNSFKT